MSLDERAQTRDLAIGGGVAAGAALVMGVLLATIAAPKAFDARLAELETSVAAAERAARPLKDAEVLPAGTVCASAAQDGQALAASLRQAASQAQLQGVRVQVLPDGDGPRRSGLVPLRVRFEAEGAYDAAVQTLDVVGRQKPQIFADSVDLVAKSGGVTLSLSGRAYCAG